MNSLQNAVISLLLATATVHAAPLKAGDSAPKLTVGKWEQGEEVKEFDRDHAYLLEFWATWCGPCKAAIPHVNELHLKYKDKGLVVIGQDVWEPDDTKVAKFVSSMADKMTYRVALDDKSDGGKGLMANNWLTAAGRNSIPTTFLVDKKGNVAWVGHPMSLKEEMIEALLAGTFVAEVADEPQKTKADSGADSNSSSMAAYAAIREKNWTKAEESINAMAKNLAEDDKWKAEMLRLDLLLAKGEQDAAAALADKTASSLGDNLPARSLIASLLARSTDPKPVILDVAEKIATHDNEAVNGTHVSSLITLARVAFLKGNQAKAVEIQTKVVELSKPTAKPRMQQFLDSFKAGKLPDTQARPSSMRPAPK